MQETPKRNSKGNGYQDKLTMESKTLSMLPAEEVLKQGPEYLPVRVGAPRVSGWKLRIFARILETPIIGRAVLDYYMRLNEIPQMLLDTSIPEDPMFLPELVDCPELGTEEVNSADGPVSTLRKAAECVGPYKAVMETSSSCPFKYWSVRDFAEAYRSGKTTPVEVAERFIKAVEESEKLDPPMNFFISFKPDDIRQQAKASAERFASGAPLSILDGVLMVVKDDIDCLPHESRGGTQWLHKFRPVKKDAVCVSKLRECGVVFAGKTNMHELGMGTTGNNPYSGTARNPYDPKRYTGGSSAGSAAVVASGLCPVALGTDAGGSIRIPSGLCGIVGLKGTFGRTTLAGLVPVGWTLEVVGPLAANVEDAMIVYSAIAGVISSDVLYSKPPPPRLPLLHTKRFQHLKFGIYSDWFFDVSSPEIGKVCKKALDRFCDKHSVQVEEVVVPELKELRNAHLITTGSEINTCLRTVYKHGRTKTCHETRVTLALFNQFQSAAYISAQRLRRRLMIYHTEMFKRVDVIITPTTGITAPRIHKDAISSGETDLTTNGDLMRFILSANFLGFPAISVPVGYDQQGLPIGLQLIGKPWHEATLLHIASGFEELSEEVKRKPAVFFDMLKTT